MQLTRLLDDGMHILSEHSIENIVQVLIDKINLIEWENKIAKGAMEGAYPLVQGSAISHLVYLLEKLADSNDNDENPSFYHFYKSFLAAIRDIVPLDIMARYEGQVDPCTNDVSVWKYSDIVAKEGIPFAAEAEFHLIIYYGTKGFSLPNIIGYMEVPPGEIIDERLFSQDRLKPDKITFTHVPNETKGGLSVLFLKKILEGKSIANIYSEYRLKKDLKEHRQFILDSNNYMLEQSARFHEIPPELILKGIQIKDNLSIEEKIDYNRSYYSKSVARLVFGTSKIKSGLESFANLFDVKSEINILDDFIIIHTDPSLSNFLQTADKNIVRIDLISMIDYEYMKALAEDAPIEELSPFNYHFFYDDLFHIFDHGEQIKIRKIKGDMFDEKGMEKELYKYWLFREKARLHGLNRFDEERNIDALIIKIDRYHSIGENAKKEVNRILNLRIVEKGGNKVINGTVPHLSLDEHLFLHRYYRNIRDAEVIETKDRYLPLAYRNLEKARLEIRTRIILPKQLLIEDLDSLAITKRVYNLISNLDTFDAGILELLGYKGKSYAEIGRTKLKRAVYNLSKKDKGSSNEIWNMLNQYINHSIETARLEERRDNHLEVARMSLGRAIDLMVENFYGTSQQKSILIRGRKTGRRQTEYHYSFKREKQGYVLLCNNQALHKTKNTDTNLRYQEHIDRIKESGIESYKKDFLLKMVHMHYLR